MPQNKNDSSKQKYNEVAKHYAKLPNNNDTPMESKFILFNYFFCFINSVIKLGSQRRQETTDLYKINSNCVFTEDYPEFKKLYENEKKKNPDILLQKVIVKHVLTDQLIVIISQFCIGCCEIIIPLFLLYYLEWYDKKTDRSESKGWEYIV